MTYKKLHKAKKNREVARALHRLHERHGFHLPIADLRRRHEMEDSNLK
jgi:hypothetical protein